MLFTDVADGDEGEIFVTEEFCLDILDDDIIFNKKEREYREKHNRQQTRAVRDYRDFVKLEMETYRLALLKFQNNGSNVLLTKYQPLLDNF